MPSTVRQQIVDAVLTRFRTILPETLVNGSANYYVTDIGNQIFEWRDLNAMPFQAAGADDLEAISVSDDEEAGENQINRHHDKVLNIELNYGTNVGGDETRVINRLRIIDADIERCIGVDRTWGGLAQDTSPPEKTEFQVIQSGRVVAAGRKNFKIKYRHQMFNQYTQ